MAEQKLPMSIRLSTELAARLERCAARLRMKKHTLAQQAIEAAVAAIERNGYRMSLPLEFRLDRDREHAPSSATYPERPAELSVAEERGPAYRTRPKK